MWTVSKAEVADLLKLNLLARLQQAQEKVALFERTHQQPFETFKQAALRGEEDFAQWDDYVEWKAYRKVQQDLEEKKVQQDLEEKIDALKRGDFEVA